MEGKRMSLSVGSTTAAEATKIPRTVRAYCPNRCTAITRTVEVASLGSEEPWRVVECQGCGLMFTDPRPPASDWHLYYPDDYGPYQVKTRVRLGKRIARGVEAWVARVVGTGPLRSLAKLWLDPTILPPAGERRMVDIGCGAAGYMARLRDAGWDVIGLEPSQRAAERAREHYGVTIVEDSFPTVKLTKGSFDLVTAHQVLEHLEDPRAALAAMRELLRPQGRVLITVPNAGSWSSRFFASAWLGWDLPRHLTHFTPASLAALAEGVGLKVQVMRTLPQGGWMRQSAERSRAAGLPRNRRWFMERNLSDSWSRILFRMGRGDNLLLIAQRVS